MILKSAFLVIFPFVFIYIARCQGQGISSSNAANGEERTCVNELGQEGACVPGSQCPELINFSKRNGGINNPDVRKFIRRRICKLLSNSAQVCCYPEARPAVANPSSLTPDTSVADIIIPTKDQCGFNSVSLPRDLDQKDYKHGIHPWLVGIGYPKDDGSFTIRCGGALITRRHVIAAAHCFQVHSRVPESSHAILGEHSPSSNTEREPPVVLRITEKKDPGYDNVSQVNDISIATLEKEVEFSDFIKPICLPFDLQGINYEEAEFTMIGWKIPFSGSERRIDVPLQIKAEGVGKTQCREAYSKFQVTIDQTQFCVHENKKDNCQGGSGGPLLYQDLQQQHKNFFLIGVASFGTGCTREIPDVYTFVPEFLNWIRDNLKS